MLPFDPAMQQPPIPAGPPGGAALAGIDPMAGAMMPAETDPLPDILGEGGDPFLMAMLDGFTKRTGFRKPRNWRDIPKPTAAQVLEFADDQEKRYEKLVARIENDWMTYDLKQSGVWESWDPDEDERMYGTGMTDEVNLVANIIAGIDLKLENVVPDPALIEKAQANENLLYRARDEAIERHTLSGGGDLAREEAMHVLVPGRVMCRILPAMDDEDWPFRESLLDPTTSFPFFQKGEMTRMVRIYADTVGNIIDEFDEDGDLADRLTKAAPDKGRRDRRKLSDEVRVIEYYDRWWRGLSVDDEWVIPITEHEYGICPFAYVQVGTGRPASVRRSSNGKVVPNTIATGSDDLAESGVAIFHYRKHSQWTMDAVHTAMLNALDKDLNDPAWMIVTDEMGQRSAAARRVLNKRGVANPIIKDHETLQPLMTQINPAAAQPVLQALNMDRDTGAMPRTAYGAAQDGQVSGNAIEGLNEAGRDKLTPYIRALQQYHARKGTIYLHLWRDWGNLYGYDDLDMPTGMLTVPSRRRGPGTRELSVTVTPEDIEETGIRVKCRMTSIRLQNLGALGNAVAMWMQAGTMSRREAMELRGAEDPTAIFDEISYENAVTSEENQAFRMYLQTAIRAGLISEDDEDYEQKSAQLYLVFAGAKLDAMLAQTTGGGGGQGGAPPGMAPPDAAMGAGMAPPGQPPMGPGAPPMGPGANQAAMMGMGPGTQGGMVGRPPGM